MLSLKKILKLLIFLTWAGIIFCRVKITIPKFFQNAHTHFLPHIDNNIVSEEEEIVECAVKHKNPRSKCTGELSTRGERKEKHYGLHAYIVLQEFH